MDVRNNCFQVVSVRGELVSVAQHITGVPIHSSALGNATNGATPTDGKLSAPAASVDTVVDEVLSVDGGWRVVTAMDEGARNGVP